MVEARNVHKVYDTGKVEVHALRGIDLTIEAGSFVAIMGPSGCGKTTLLNCFSGLDDLTEGEVYIEGTNLEDMSDNEKTRYRALRMGFIFQAYNLLPVFNAVENVELPLLVAGRSPRAARAKALEVLDSMGLSGWEGHKPAELSAGQQQRVAIARSLVNDPAIVWADEPTGNLDTETSLQIVEILKKLNRENGQTFVLVTHDINVAEKAGRILKMRSGLIESDMAMGG
jgi:putative ABC transport system ATP-binding protein